MLAYKAVLDAHGSAAFNARVIPNVAHTDPEVA